MSTEKTNYTISIVIPVFNEEGNISILTQELTALFKNTSPYEILFVDDGSTDQTLNVIKKERKDNNNVRFLSFSRNFGHQNALRAGLDFASGDCVISLDGDMQHPPKLIPTMIEKWKEGYDIVYTIREDDPKISFFKKITARFFYFLINALSDITIEKGAADFRLLDKRVVQALKGIRESNLFMRGMISWLGFRQIGILYMPESRHWGKTKYTFHAMLKLAIAGITGFSIRPLHISTLLGYGMATGAFLYGLYALYTKLFTDTAISGWTSTLVAILFVGGIQMVMIGILGEYIGKLFIESKKRPNYIIKEKTL